MDGSSGIVEMGLLVIIAYGDVRAQRIPNASVSAIAQLGLVQIASSRLGSGPQTHKRRGDEDKDENWERGKNRSRAPRAVRARERHSPQQPRPARGQNEL